MHSTQRTLGGHRFYDEATGLVRFTLPRKLTDELGREIKAGFERGVANGRDDTLCLLSESETRYFGGFNTYEKMQGMKNAAGFERQRKYTTMIPKRQLPFLHRAVPQFHALASHISELELGAQLELYSVDVLRQSSSGNDGALESLFEWHQDNEGNRRIVSHTVVVLLTPTATSMQMKGFDRCEYAGAGSGVAFMADDVHCSLLAGDGTIKIALFFVEMGSADHLWFCRGFDRPLPAASVAKGCDCWLKFITDWKIRRCKNNAAGCLRIVSCGGLCSHCTGGDPSFVSCRVCGRTLHAECTHVKQGAKRRRVSKAGVAVCSSCSAV